jgi:hypothetical protein
MIDSDRPLPPLIFADETPRLVRWRDFLLTLLMWLIFAVMLETEFELFFGHYLEGLGLGDFNTEGNWPEFFERLTPFFFAIATLVILLTVASMNTLRRRKRSLLLPAPAPLGLAEECRRTGIDEATLVSARALRIAIVRTDTEAGFRIDAG